MPANQQIDSLIQTNKIDKIYSCVHTYAIIYLSNSHSRSLVFFWWCHRIPLSIDFFAFRLSRMLQSKSKHVMIRRNVIKHLSKSHTHTKGMKAIRMSKCEKFKISFTWFDFFFVSTIRFTHCKMNVNMQCDDLFD